MGRSVRSDRFTVSGKTQNGLHRFIQGDYGLRAVCLAADHVCSGGKRFRPFQEGAQIHAQTFHIGKQAFHFKAFVVKNPYAGIECNRVVDFTRYANDLVNMLFYLKPSFTSSTPNLSYCRRVVKPWDDCNQATNDLQPGRFPLCY
jgi:hypothetical protein